MRKSPASTPLLLRYPAAYLTDLVRSGVRLCFDVGQVRIGVAKCDRDQILAVPVMTLLVDDQTDANVTTLISEVAPAVIYVGLPINMKGVNTASTEAAISFADQLSQTEVVTSQEIEIRLIDERLSTSSALGALRDSGKSARDSKGLVDQVAAVEILDLAIAIEKRTGSLAGTEIQPQSK